MADLKADLKALVARVDALEKNSIDVEGTDAAVTSLEGRVGALHGRLLALETAPKPDVLSAVNAAIDTRIASEKAKVVTFDDKPNPGATEGVGVTS